MRHTPSSRRRLKAIGQRENRWMQDINHQVSKALVENNPKHTLFVLEDLSGIRNATERVKKKIVMFLYRMGINYLADSQVPNTVVTE